MRLVIDMQGAQASNSKRGIGRYSLMLSKEMARLRGEHEVILVLNGMFQNTIDEISSAFTGLLPEKNIRVWDAVNPVNYRVLSNDSRRLAAEYVREAFIASIQPDIVLITSLFEGLGDDAITSVGAFTSSLKTAVILYDLIPLIHRNVYLKNETVERWYLNKLDQLRRADLLLSISASSGKEVVEHLNIAPASVNNISTACDSHFQPIVVDEALMQYLQKTYGLVRPFVMYTGGIDHRKNIENLIRAFAKLPIQLRSTHQLVVVCSIENQDRSRLHQLAIKEGLECDDVVFTGFVPDSDLVLLYNSCKLFVFPSWHEGFGLPALEAMSCGSAVIGSNTSSVPEVIGCEDALFDPYNVEELTEKIAKVLTNDDYRAELKRHGLIQSKNFSWEQTALLAWQSLTTLNSQHRHVPALIPAKSTKNPRLAYISPLPPERSGIADYSAELLPELAKHYVIDVIVLQKEVLDPWILTNCSIRDVTWFRSNAYCFDRILYHFGNSQFHSHMFDLVSNFPGVVMLHDFFLSGVIAHMDIQGVKPNCLAQALLQSHGWDALQLRYHAKDTADAIYRFPCNISVLQQSLGIIVHSDNSRRLALQWYGASVADDWALIPLLRTPVSNIEREAKRHSLGLVAGDFVVCSFGLLGPTKLNHRLLEAWLDSPLANDPHCRLIFIGQNHSSDYGKKLQSDIRNSTAASRITITGWVDSTAYQTWLAVADASVQLRTLSRGETSAAVLDCMNYGIATIVNANGSMADLPYNAVWRLPDEFSKNELIEALTTLRNDTKMRDSLSQSARDEILSRHQPRQCADLYFAAIEKFYQKAATGLQALVGTISKIKPTLLSRDLPLLAVALANNFPPSPRRKQLFLDISEFVQRDTKSGIQRVVRSLLQEILLNPPDGWAVEPVYATSSSPGYRYARCFTSRFLNIDDSWAADELVEAWQGDIFLGLDLQPQVVPAQQAFYQQLRHHGVKVYFVVYDLLCILHPEFFVEGAKESYRRWLEVVTQGDGAVCISQAVANELSKYQAEFAQHCRSPFKVAWFHLGGDLVNSVPTSGLPANADHIITVVRSRPTFLMVGTIEPRKGYAQTLAAFELLWNQKIEVNLVIVGKQGWMVETLIERIRCHPELNLRLIWLEGISDEYLEKIYAASTCLIAASEGEGFGLPLIEAAQFRIPIIARDIPVFREVAGNHATYFSGLEPQTLADAVKDWQILSAQNKIPLSNNIPCLTWRESAQNLLEAISIGNT